jgi:hypothetical protein
MIFRKLTVATIALTALGLTANAARADNPIRVETKTAKSGEKYSFIFINNAPVRLVDSEPDKTDKKRLLSMPIAFTSVTAKIIGAFVHEGKVECSVSKKLGGALKISNDRFEVIDTVDGAVLTDAYLDELAKNGGSLVQQFLVVKGNQPCKFRDKGLAQRRVIANLNDGKEVVIESNRFMTLSKFATDLSELGVKNCLYSDLGAWGQSWLRDSKSGKLKNLANEKSVTENHTNWFLVSEPTTLD